ncbi:MAG TPA: hypothetical protein VK835_03340 [Bacteroidia bacterium]|nr:hypothetical protein [Bacteroidia bacterium]
MQVKAQDTKVTRSIVLLSDSVPIYGIWYPANSFKDSYFVCVQEYSVKCDAAEFQKLSDGVKNRNSDILIFKSKDEKSITCIFPKHTLSGINNLHAFMLNLLGARLIERVVLKKTTLVEVVDKYDPLDTESEKGYH